VVKAIRDQADQYIHTCFHVVMYEPSFRDPYFSRTGSFFEDTSAAGVAKPSDARDKTSTAPRPKKRILSLGEAAVYLSVWGDAARKNKSIKSRLGTAGRVWKS